MPILLEYEQRRPTALWFAQATAVAMVCYAPAYLAPFGTGVEAFMMAASALFVVALIPLGKRLPVRHIPVLHLRENGELEILLAKDPHLGVGSSWRHRVTVDAHALDRIQFARMRTTTGIPDQRRWHWVRLSAGDRELDTWLPDGRRSSVAQALTRLAQSIECACDDAGDLGPLQEHRRAKERSKQTPGARWP